MLYILQCDKYGEAVDSSADDFVKSRRIDFKIILNLFKDMRRSTPIQSIPANAFAEDKN
jgi:hypothetical protein